MLTAGSYDGMRRDKCIRVLGVDTSLRSTGVGVVEARGNKFSAIEFGVLKNARDVSLSGCLKSLHEGIGGIIDRTAPDAAAVEGVFFAKNVKTTMILGEARGVVIAACALRGIPVFEYSPRKVKQAIVGHGSADKEQVRKMVTMLLSMGEEPQEDAGDALAIAVCHMHNRTGCAVLAGQSI